jgi:hypothetical protein
MRSSNRRATLAAVVLAAGLVAACGPAAPASLPVTPRPTPLITPDPHLSEPVSIDEVYKLLDQAGLRITANTATLGTDGITIKRINATYADWPLVLTQYSSSAALLADAKFDTSKPPRLGESPYNMAGLNILAEFGPHSTNDRTPAPPSADKREAAIALAEAMDPLLGPLSQRSTEPLPLPTPLTTPAPPTPTALPSS